MKIAVGLPEVRPGRPPLWSQGFSAFRHRNYRLYFFGQLVSVTGTWMQSLAQSWLVLTLTGSALKLGLVNVLQFAPILVFGLMAGVVADRFPKRAVLLATQSVSALLAATLAILSWTDTVQLWHVYALALGLGIVNSFDMPTRQAFVSEMVGKDDLGNAIALNSMLFNAGRLIGPALAGLLLAGFGVTVCFALNSFSYLAVICALLLMQLAPVVVERAGSPVERLREGLHYVRNTPEVLLPIVLIGFLGTFGLNFTVWMPLLAKKEFDAGAGGFGLLMSALGLGAFAGALALAFFGRGHRPRRMIATALALGVAEIVLAVAAALGVRIGLALLIAPVLGFAMTATMALANTMVQTASPEELRGRVMSVYMMVFAGSAPFGALMAGALASAFGTPVSILAGGIITLCATVAVAIGGGIWHPFATLGRASGPPVTSTRSAPGKE